MVLSRTSLCWIFLLALCQQKAQSQDTVSLEEGFFHKKLYPIFEKVNCRGCHIEDGVAGATRLHFPPESVSQEQIESFGRSLRVLVDGERPSDSLLLKKPTQRIEHTGGRLISPGSEEEKMLMAWISYLAGLSNTDAGQPSSHPLASPTAPLMR